MQTIDKLNIFIFTDSKLSYYYVFNENILSLALGAERVKQACE